MMNLETMQDYEENLNFTLTYADENGKEWRFCRLKKTRAFIREDGKRFSHTAIYNNYEFVERKKMKAK